MAKASILLLISCFFLLACSPSNEAGKRVFDITDYGAKGDSLTLDTEFIQKAVDEAASAGGGRVIVPPGIFLSGAVFLKSNINFEVMNGATILGSPNIGDYTPVRWGHNKDRQPYHLIVVKEADNVTIEV